MWTRLLKANHSLVGRSLIPLILKVKSKQGGDLGELARLKKDIPLESYSYVELNSELEKLTGESLKDIILLSGVDNTLDAARQILHEAILLANVAGAPNAQVQFANEDDGNGPTRDDAVGSVATTITRHPVTSASTSSETVTSLQLQAADDDVEALTNRKKRMQMGKATCGFCHRDKTVNNVCGKLRQTNVDGRKVAAHHKCMQYSAKLVQYRFKSFGGFKKDEVIKELNRGRTLICYICQVGVKKKKTKEGFNKNGATAGCELKSCRRKFHFYCAKTKAITKRFKTRNKDGENIDVYRVFCSLAHEKEFRANASEQYQDISSSEVSSSEEDGSSDNEINELACNGEREDDSVYSKKFNNGVKRHAKSSKKQLSDMRFDGNSEDVSEESSIQIITSESSDEEQEQLPRSEKHNVETSSSDRTKVDSILNTSNSIKVRAEIHQIQQETKKMTSTKKTSETKTVVRAKMRNNKSSDDDREAITQPSLSCTKKPSKMMLLGKQIVLKPREISAMKERVNVESTDRIISNKPLVERLSLQTDHQDSQKLIHHQEKDNDHGLTNTKGNKGKSDLMVTSDDSLNGISKNNGKKDNNRNKRLSTMNGKSATKRAKLSEDTSNNKESDTDDSNNEFEVENSRFSTCGLILTQDQECSHSVRVELLRLAEKELSMTENYLAFLWDAHKLKDLQKEIMPHLMYDIGGILCNDEGNKRRLSNLLTNTDKLRRRISKYSYDFKFYKSMDKRSVSDMLEILFEQLRKNLDAASSKTGYTVGKLLTVQKMNALIMTVNDKLDPKGLIRRKMFPDTTDRLFECSASTHLHSLNKEPSVLQAEKEKCKILNFIKEEFGKDFNLELSPTETVFQSTESSNVKTISEKLSTKPAETKNKVLCLFPVDNNVVNFSPFCKKLLAQFVWQTIQDESTRVIAIIHLDSSVNTFDDIVRTNVVEEQHLCMLVANDPNETPVSCAVVTNIPYRDRLKRTGQKEVAPEIKDSVGTPRQHLPLIRTTKEDTQVVRSSPRKPPI